MEEGKNKKRGLVFESLTPVEDSELGVYETALDYVFQSPDIKNVALSGAYGAGKSSVLASYKKKSSSTGRKYIHISLAHFEDEGDSVGNGEIKESVLEGKILNQLIHQIPESRIPQTNFRIKSAFPQKTIIKISVILSLLVLLLLHLTLSTTWENFIKTFKDGIFKSILLLSTTPLAYLVSGVVLSVIVAFLIYQAVILQRNRRFIKKLNLQGNEIEIFEDSNESYFDKYLNEVLYLFENADADVIVFEDMDRFNANQIFERLREINTLINLKANDRIIRFFYLLKDDIFTSKDRTKFFDFIIPVVPVVDGSNSYDQFISHLQKNDLLDKFDERFLKGLSLYVDEMRLLKNICNEFLVYYNRLNTTELDYNKMLAIITYKNLFPRDFSELQLGRGFVHALFEHKESFAEEEIKRIEGSIAETEQRIQRINAEVLRDTNELKIVYDNKKEPYSRSYGYWNRDEVNRLDAEKQARSQLIEDKNNDIANQLQEQIEQKKKELATLKAKPLHEIINRENIDEVFRTEKTNEIGTVNSFLDVKSNSYFPVLKYLIRNGYIDETYSDYMTYFYENSLSRTDKVFLRSITDCKAKEYQYELKNPKKVLEQLDEFDFDQEEILNYSLIDYLLQTNPASHFIQHFVHQLQEKKRYEFITGYLSASKVPVEFVHQCNMHWKGLFRCLISDNVLSEENLNRYAVLTLYSADTRAIELSNEENCLAEYISKSSRILAIEEPKIDYIIQGFTLLNVLIDRLDYSTSDKSLFMAVYENNLYVISFENVREILRCVYGIANEEYILHSNYSAIYSLPGSPVKEYIEANFPAYMEIKLEFCEGTITDTNEAAGAILNNPEVSQEQKYQYIEYLKEPLLELASVQDADLWPALIDFEAVVFSETNAIDYFNHSREADPYFVHLINMADRVIDFKEAITKCEPSEIDRLFESIISCNELEDEKYEQSIVSLNHTCNTFTISGLSIQKVLILVKHSMIPMNIETLSFLRINYTEAVGEFIYKNADEYVDLIDEQSFDYSEMLQILSMDLREDLKLKLLGLTDKPVTIINKGYSSAINKHILTNNLNESDIPVLFERYEACPPDIQKIILNYSIRKPESIESSIDSCSMELINDFFSSIDLTIETKMVILSALLYRLSKEESTEYLKLLGLTEYVKIFDSHAKPKFSITHENELLLDAFVRKGWLYEYLEDPDRENYYKVRRREPHKTTALHV